jgi:alcohol dehydrogenase YqhD (iron-dependent ADH family)
MALILSDRLKDFFKNDLGLKTTLDELQISDEHFEIMANRATKGNTSPVGHYIPLDVKRFVDILKLARS